MIKFSSMKREQRETIGLLQVGTFLEYFDVMLYVHMSVILNDLFFPKTDYHTAQLLSAFAFCSTYVFRPFGALIFGYIGDNIGRKATVVITTMLMAVSCVIMATVPDYYSIGIMASWIVTICRIMQGVASMGEIIGAELYLTEMFPAPRRYPIVALVGFSAAFGSVVALGTSMVVTKYGLNWRHAFWIGAIIALIGSTARTTLRETPEFADVTRRIKNAITSSNNDGLGKAAVLLQNTSNAVYKEKTSFKTFLSYFLIQCPWPVCFYFTYVYSGDILKQVFHYTSSEVIYHNFFIALVQLFSVVMLIFLSARVYPLKILKYKLIMFSVFMLICPLWLNSLESPLELMLIQSIIILLALDNLPAIPIFFIHFPVLRRFTNASFTFALSRAFMYIITSFGIVYLHESFGYFGLWVIVIPMIIGYSYGLAHFYKLEKEVF